MFRDRVRFGPSFPCITCQQLMFFHQVLEYENVKSHLQQKCSESLLKKATFINDNFYKTFEVDEIQGSFKITFKSGGNLCFLCKVCYSHLENDTLPPKAAANCLETVFVPDHVKLKSY